MNEPLTQRLTPDTRPMTELERLAERLRSSGPRAHGPDRLMVEVVAWLTDPNRRWDEPALSEARERLPLDELRQRYAAWVRACELTETENLLSHAAAELELGDFGRRAYARVQDMFEVLDFDSIERVVMVGSGPLPATLFHIADRSRAPNLVGLDTDPQAINLSRALARRFQPRRLTIEAASGQSFDYAGASAVYVANLVRPKAAVLARIAETAAPGTTVVLRDPAGAGELLAETGVQGLDPRFEVTREGPADAGFLSRHVFLRLSGG